MGCFYSRRILNEVSRNIYNFNFYYLIKTEDKWNYNGIKRYVKKNRQQKLKSENNLITI